MRMPGMGEAFVQLQKNERLDFINERLKLIQNKTHLSFGTDALLLAGYLSKGRRAAELGAGNGVVSLLAGTRGKFLQIDGFELQESAAELFRRNVLLNDLKDIVSVKNEDIRFLPGKLKGQYDCVFSNPPYMKNNTGKPCVISEKQTARHETAGDIYDFCRTAAELLRFGGEAVFVYRPDRLCDLFDAMRCAGTEPKRVTAVCADPMHAPSMVLVSGKKGGKGGLYFSPVFHIADLAGEKTEEYKKLMEKGCFDERYLKP